MRTLLATLLVFETLSYSQAPYVVSTLAGPSGLSHPHAVAVTKDGAILVADTENHFIRIISPSGIVTNLVGTGVCGTSGNGGPAGQASVCSPTGLAIDAAGNIYISDQTQVRRISISGIITLIGGGAMTGSAGNGGLATSALFNKPSSLAFDSVGNLYVLDAGNSAVRRISPSGMISPFYGCTTACKLTALAIDGHDNVFVSNDSAITKLTSGGNASFAAAFGASALAIARDGSLLATTGTMVLQGQSDGSYVILAGSGMAGYGGDNGNGAITFDSIAGLAVDSTSAIIIADTNNNRVRKLQSNAAAQLSLVSGDQQSGTVNTALRNPLAVKLVGAAGFPLAGFPLTFTVTSGSAQLASRVATTDANGAASTTVTLGPSAGPVVVTASLLTLPPVTFHLQAITFSPPAFLITRVAGFSAPFGDNVQALAALLQSPSASIADSSGNLYIAETGTFRIRRVTRDGVIATFAGNGLQGYSGDGGQATGASLGGGLSALTLDVQGSLFFSDPSTGLGRIRKAASDGTISTVAGGGTGGEGGPAIAAKLFPTAIAFDLDQTLLIADSNANRIWKVTADGTLVAFAGSGASDPFAPDGDAATAAMYYPTGLAVGQDGSVYVSETCRIRVIRGGVISALAGTCDAYAMGAYSVADGPANSLFLNTNLLAVDPSGTLYFAEPTRVRKLTADGNIVTIAGSMIPGTVGADGSQASASHFAKISGLASTPDGSLIVTDRANQSVMSIQPDGTIRTLAGAPHFAGDGEAATGAIFSSIQQVASDSAGSIFVSDTYIPRIRRIDSSTGTIATVVGTGMSGSSGDGGLAVAAQFFSAAAMAIDNAGSLLIADNFDHRIRRVDSATGMISTIAGTGDLGFSGDGGAAVTAQLNAPSGLAVDAAGNIFIADTSNSRVRKIALDGTISTVAGTGVAGFAGDGGPAVAARLVSPTALAFDPAGNLYISDTGNYRIRKVSPAGVISTSVGNGTSNPTFNNGVPASGSPVGGVVPSIGFDDQGSMYFVSYTIFNGMSRIKLVDNQGLIGTVAGGGSNPVSDGDDATSDMLTGAASLTFLPDGRIVVGAGSTIEVLSRDGATASLVSRRVPGRH